MNEENYLLFDQYLQNEMSVEAKNAFEKQLAADKSLALAFETFKEMQFQLTNKFAFEKDRVAFKTNLKTISEAHFRSSKAKVIQLKPWYFTVAASVAILIGIFFLNQNSNPRFEDFNQPEEAYFTERSSSNKTLKQAEIAFNAKEYNKAIPLFETLLKENKTAEIQYFYGISLLEENQFKQSETVFNELKSGTSAYKNKAIWSLALSKLKQKDYKACKEILLTIPADYENFEEVQKLLKELD
ncbi:tetratricopeptide repeat protein [Flavobacterium sp. Fl-77]|uniref:Tetratricopeptide repeat protein n=1 Tax=Flavobacterium flavipigmentatum TaxID=2893884 RepID=A0AAJ2S5C1_9FLAO|nr:MULTISPECIES: tetratricopeptide repeat protein [unclassified Flavobacterium]MDX6181187.1 tetratricopeptide repeat protein [Flavobacterium sp. Fl-33]MDX6184788.1 tetratricopeptide repeat protein [Flavobacterium sp. Fl-77]UFH39885.1 tetratricopeptide repeat protein [Flavobacterium sp. F-70]